MSTAASHADSTASTSSGVFKRGALSQAEILSPSTSITPNPSLDRSGSSTSQSNLLVEKVEDHRYEGTKGHPNKNRKFALNTKTLVGLLTAGVIVVLIVDSLLRPPEQRLINPDFAKEFLSWVHDHPARGLVAYVVAYAVTVIALIPGTPLTLGGGYVFKALYGWVIGITVATLACMIGSAMGAIGCFLLGRYLMRERVRLWSRKYPLFDAIDLAVSEHGFKIMAMLYLTPVLPLGPVSYMCGTTSMKLSSFVLAKVASMPIMLLIVFVGATTGTLVSEDGQEKKISHDENWMSQHSHELMIGGIILSTVTIGVVGHLVKKELYTILDRQKQERVKDDDETVCEQAMVTTTEMKSVTKNSRYRRLQDEKV